MQWRGWRRRVGRIGAGAFGVLSVIGILAGLTVDLPIAVPIWLGWLEALGEELREAVEVAAIYYGLMVVGFALALYTLWRGPRYGWINDRLLKWEGDFRGVTEAGNYIQRVTIFTREFLQPIKLRLELSGQVTRAGAHRDRDSHFGDRLDAEIRSRRRVVELSHSGGWEEGEAIEVDLESKTPLEVLDIKRAQ